MFNLLPHFSLYYQQNRKSLLSGINYYSKSNKLNDYINDTNNVKTLIVSKIFSSKNENMRLLIENTQETEIDLTTNDIIKGIFDNVKHDLFFILFCNFIQD